MNFKKIAISAAAGAVMLAAAVPAMAYYHPMSGVSVMNTGSINNTSVNVANTGLNAASGKHASVTTGSAVSLQETQNMINTSVDSSKKGSVKVSNFGSINNTSVNGSNTGLNVAGYKGSVKTGGAVAGQGVTNVVNTSVGAGM
ncbi:MAG TPA: hypothetical protein VG917_03905 [Patescibacteria group bacterium]|nr:hypothetical protein [Patescibacteria group bacterium]